MNKLKYILGLAAVSVFVLCSLKAQEPPAEYPTVQIPAWHAEAMAVALREFKKKYRVTTVAGRRFNDLRDYTVSIAPSPSEDLPIEYEREACIRIEFVPEFTSNGRQDAKSETRVTASGVNVAYHICRRTMEIVKVSFSRD